MLVFTVVCIFLALLFDFLNGMNDAANSIATIVSTRVLTPRKAVLWAAFFNFISAFFFGVHVANTIGKGIVEPEIVNAPMIFAVLTGAISWTWICTYVGMPISVSHALVGGLIGSALAKTNDTSMLISSGVWKVSIFIIVAPLIGLILGYIFMVATYWICRKQRPGTVDRWFRRFQLFSAALYSIGHGTNDAQKTMGIIAVLLYSTGYLEHWFGMKEFGVPWIIVISCYICIALGTLAGGWRVIRTLGMEMTKLKPVQGFCAESAAASSLLLSSSLGIPVSTTHTITGAIIGTGATVSLSTVRWGVAFKIVLAWILTIPTSALVSAIVWYCLNLVWYLSDLLGFVIPVPLR